MEPGITIVDVIHALIQHARFPSEQTVREYMRVVNEWYEDFAHAGVTVAEYENE